MSDDLGDESFADDFDDYPEGTFEQDDSPDEPTEEPFDEFAELESTPVEETDAVYQHWRDHFGETDADQLQAKWGDSAVEKDANVTRLLNAAPELGTIYSNHPIESGGLSIEGVSASFQWIQDATSKTPEILSREHPELESLYFDYMTDDGGISPAGVAILMSYIGENLLRK